MKEIFESSLSGYGLKEICRTLNDRGITNRGKRWYKGGLHYLLTNEAYTGTEIEFSVLARRLGQNRQGREVPGPRAGRGGMREAASRGFFLGSKAPFGYKRVKVSDGAKERPTLEVDPATAPIVKEIFESSLSGYGLKEICRTLNDRGITNRGKRWYKGGLHYLLTNEAYTGTAVWGRTGKGEKSQDPVRVEGTWLALVSRELFDAVQEATRDRAPKVRRPARVGSRFLLSGLLKCGVCGRPYSGQGAKSGQYGYYICGTLFGEGAGTCSARYLNAPRAEEFFVENIRERILTEETIVELVKLVAEEIDAMAGELAGRLEVIAAELLDVRKRLERLYEALETSELTLEVLSPRILSLRHREEQLEAAREDAIAQLEQRRVELPTTEEIKGYVANFREFLQEGTFPEHKASSATSWRVSRWLETRLC